MAIDLVINCFERNYKSVLTTQHVDSIRRQHQHEFDEITVLVNNVVDLPDALGRGEALVSTGSASRVMTVAENLPQALATTGLSLRRLGGLPHHTDFALVAMTLPGPDLVLYVDPEGYMREPVNWIEPIIDIMRKDARVAVGSPAWYEEESLHAETIEWHGSIALGYGFSDIVFLTRRSEMGHSIYRHFAPASWRYPASHITPVFEQRIDAYMRAKRRLRAVYTRAVFEYGAAGQPYHATTPLQKMLMKRRDRVSPLLRHGPPRFNVHPDRP